MALSRMARSKQDRIFALPGALTSIIAMISQRALSSPNKTEVNSYDGLGLSVPASWV